MRPIFYKRHRFPAEVIRHAVWLYFRFTLSFRDVEESHAAVYNAFNTQPQLIRRSTLRQFRAAAHQTWAAATASA